MLTLPELAALDKALGERRVLSVYLDGTATDPAARGGWRLQLKHSLHDLRIWLEGSPHAERQEFERCVRSLEAELTKLGGTVGASGWVAFITGDGVHFSSGLPVQTPTLAVWSTGICLAPYMRVLKETRPVIAAIVDATRAELYRYDRGTLSQVASLHAHHAVMAPSHMGDAPRAGFHPGTRGDTGHDAAQRSLLAGAGRMISEVAKRVTSEAGPDGWILVGGIPEESRRLGEKLLGQAPDRVYVATLDVHATEAEIGEAARSAASLLRDRMDLARVADIIDSGEATGLGALGPADARFTLDQSRVRDLYVTRRYLEDHAAEAEDAVRAALAQGAAVEEVSGSAAELLDAHGGMAARLRYRLLPEAAPV
jgi:hypothetical protein